MFYSDCMLAYYNQDCSGQVFNQDCAWIYFLLGLLLGKVFNQDLQPSEHNYRSSSLEKLFILGRSFSINFPYSTATLPIDKSTIVHHKYTN